jgi:DivIVA domain-containing protein
MSRMELSPKTITGVQFRTVRKGYDPEEVRGFLGQLARGVETIQAQAAASDARARSAMAKLQELAAREEPDPGESMKRTLVLAQRTADAAVAEANEQAKSIVVSAEERSRTMLADAQARSEQMVTDAEVDARRAGSVERARADAEIAALTSRRDELHAEAALLESQISTQRTRIAGAVAALSGVLERPDGLQPSPLPPPSPDPREREEAEAAAEGARLAAEPAPHWSDARPEAADATEPSHPAAAPAIEPPPQPTERREEDDDDIAAALARLGEASTQLSLEANAPLDGPPTAEVPVISSDDELVRNFFEPEPFTDDRWKGRRTD